MKAEDQLPRIRMYVYSQRPRQESKLDNLFEVYFYFKNDIQSQPAKSIGFRERVSINTNSIMVESHHVNGPIIACFYEEELAKEYCNWKNNQLKITI